MTLNVQALVLVMTLLLIQEGNSTPQEVYENDINANVSSSPKKDENQLMGCRTRPWICLRGEFPPRTVCCGDRCVDLTSDRDNCGLCGIRCSLVRQCCNRLCLNIYVNPFNCGRCGNVCPIGRLCLLGFCSASQQTTTPISPPLPIPPPLENPPRVPELPPPNPPAIPISPPSPTLPPQENPPRVPELPPPNPPAIPISPSLPPQENPPRVPELPPPNPPTMK
ncbi:hypothetical protein RJT34_10883 [Clitoria ternatea]|uniref:Stigma-specific protein Stig1 n=1 Tax=Clitoria ternatea TaxID=43366 RepID=A0AAN9PIY8_CLITE